MVEGRRGGRYKTWVLGWPDPSDCAPSRNTLVLLAIWGAHISSVQRPTETGRPSGQAAPSCMLEPVLPAG